MPNKKQIQLTEEPPTPWPPTNPKWAEYEAQKGHLKKHTQIEDESESSPNHSNINITALFALAGFICGTVIVTTQPKDFRSNFSFYSPLPHAYHTKAATNDSVSLNMAQTSQNKRETEQDLSKGSMYALFLGASAGVAGKAWHLSWTRPLRIRALNAFELREILKELRGNWARNCVKGTLCGSACVLGMLYLSVFWAYLYLGQFLGNKYVDLRFWDFMELSYQKSIEGLKDYEFNLELTERRMEQYKMSQPPLVPSMDSIDSEAQMELSESERKEKETKEKRRDLYKKSVRAMEWNTDLYLSTKDMPYHKLSEDARHMRWNMAREMAMLACSCSMYIVLPVFFGASLFATRMYNNYWWRLMQQMIKSKASSVPHKTY